MKDSETERPTSPRAIRGRLDQVFGPMPNEVVAAKINAVGGKASKEKVRRYRDPTEEGAERVAVDFVADVALAFGKDPAWLLTGEGFPDRKPADVSQRAFEEIMAVVERYRGLANSDLDDAEALRAARDLAERAGESPATPPAPSPKGARPDTAEPESDRSEDRT